MRITVTLLAFLITAIVYGQQFDTGNIDVKHFNLSLIEEQLKSDAVNLLQERETVIDYEGDDGWIFKTKVRRVVRVNNKSAQDLGVLKLRLYKDGSDEEVLRKVSVVTYNLENEKVVKSKTSKKQFLKEKIDEHRTDHIHIAQSLKDGSIIEYYYEIESPFWKIDDLIIQDIYPTLAYKAFIKIPQFFGFNIFRIGDFPIIERQETSKETVVFSYTQKNSNGAIMSTSAAQHASMKVDMNKLFYEAEHIPALIDEPYVDALDNYRSSVIFELNSVTFPGKSPKMFALTWENVAIKMFEDDNFGKRFEKSYFLDQALIAIRKEKQDGIRIEEAIYKYVQNNFTCNGQLGKYIDRPLKKAYESKRASVAEINTILYLLLRKANIDAQIVLANTKPHGIMIYPSLEAFNYLIVNIYHKGELIKADASQKTLKFGFLPATLLNQQGREIRPGGVTKSVDLQPKSFAITQEFLDYSIGDDGDIEGEFKRTFQNQDNMTFIAKNRGDLYIKASNKITKPYNKINLENTSVSINEDISEETGSFVLENQVSVIDNKMTINPLLFIAQDINPYRQKKRLFPVDMMYKNRMLKEAQFEIPNGYKIESLPEDKVLKFGDQQGFYKYSIREIDNQLVIKAGIQLNADKVPSTLYKDLQTFFEEIVQTETTPIVLVQKQ